MRFSRMLLAIAFLFTIGRATAEPYSMKRDLDPESVTTLTTTLPANAITKAGIKPQQVLGTWQNVDVAAAWNNAQGLSSSLPLCTVESVKEYGPCGSDRRGITGVTHLKRKATEEWYKHRVAQGLHVPTANEMVVGEDAKEMTPRAVRILEHIGMSRYEDRVRRARM